MQRQAESPSADKNNEKQKAKKKKNPQPTEPDELESIEPAVGPAAGLSGLVLGGGAAAAAGAAAVAAGAGGGGGGGNDSSVPAPSPGFFPPPSKAGLPEKDAQAGLFLINAFDAFDRNLSGSGITIGIVDGGIDGGHNEFTGRIRGCFDAASGQAGCHAITITNHATHVAGIAAAAENGQGIIGVAPQADILNADIFRGSKFSVGHAQQAGALNWIVGQGADVLNNSYGTQSHNLYSPESIRQAYEPGTSIGNAYANAVSKDVIMVWSTGNDGASEPGLLSALPVYFPAWKDHWIATTAVTSKGGALTAYANACGAAAAFCVAAPGGEASTDGGVYSSIAGDNYGNMAGTSMAAPHVTGAVAILLEKFGPGTPTGKTPEQIVDLLFATANKSGIYGNSAIYGQGLVDLEKATRPDNGTLAFPTGQGETDGSQLVSDTSLHIGSAFGDAGVQAFEGKLAGAVDQYGRFYFSDLGDLSYSANAMTDGMDLMKNSRPKDVITKKLGVDQSVSFSFSPQAPVPEFANGAATHGPLERFSYASHLSNGMEFSAHYGFQPGAIIGLQADHDMDHSLLAANMQTVNPYFDFAQKGSFAVGMETPLSGNLKIRSLAFMSRKDKADPLGINPPEQNDTVSGTAIEAVFPVGERMTFSLLGGSVLEDENILGMAGQGGMDLGNGTSTFFTGPSFSYELEDDINFVGNWQTGWTDAGSAENALVSDFSTIRSDSFTLGFTGERLFRERDEWGILLHQPLRVSEAEATLSVSAGRAPSGHLVYEEGTINFEPSGREKNFQAFYKIELDEKQSFAAGLMLRDESGHVKDAEPEGVTIMRYRLKF